ncbi:MAG: MFS superfamily sulfate permease-like transporter [Candidatus Azotimanducaceae bacterium]|jgi:MFS superfamily sulfate permease-like transporter
MSDTQQKADWGTRRKEGTFVVHFSGSWVNGAPKPSPDTLHLDIESEADLKMLHLEADHLTGWDSSLLVAVRQLCEWAQARGLRAQLDGMPQGVQNLLKLSQAVPENKQLGEEVRSALDQYSSKSEDGCPNGMPAVALAKEVVVRLIDQTILQEL